MSKLFTTGWYDRVEALLAAAIARGGSALVAAKVLANHQSKTQGDITGGGTPTALFTADSPITTTAGAPGNFAISAGASVSVSADGQDIQFQVLRDGSAVGPQLTAVSASTHASESLAFIDNPGPGTFTYALQIINDGVATHNVEALTSSGSTASAYLVVAETL